MVTDACFVPEDAEDGLVRGLDDLCAAVVSAVDEGHKHRAPIPILLAVSTVHHHLIREGRRSVLPKFRKVAAKSALSEDGPMTVVRRHLKRLRESARPRARRSIRTEPTARGPVPLSEGRHDRSVAGKR